MTTGDTIRAQYAESSDQAAAANLRSSPIFRNYVRPCCAEILGTLIFTFTCSLSATVAPELAPLSVVIISLVQGATIIFLYGSLAPISGGHYNPAISFATWLGGGCGCVIMFFYMICQILGGFVGALLFRTVLIRNVYLTSAVATVPAINLKITTIGQAVLMEIIGSFIWALVVLMTTIDNVTPSQAASPFIGSMVFVVTLLSYSMTKSSLNPARAFGSTLAYTVFADGEWQDHYVFWVGPFLGATVAVAVYRLIFANDDKRLLFKK